MMHCRQFNAINRNVQVSSRFFEMFHAQFCSQSIRNPTFQKPPKEKNTLEKKKEKINCQPLAIPNTPSVYTVPMLGPEDHSISQHLKDKQKIFEGMYTCYLPPEEFQYNLPTKNKCEIAFIGRSNVGKSSLIDALLGGKKIVRISKEAGCTTQINFFGFIKGFPVDYTPIGKKIIQEDQHFAYLVDMPGYGFAKRSKQLMKQWDNALQTYLLNRNQTTLRRVYILIDSRHGVKLSDTHMMDTLNTAFIPYQLVFTKCDLTPKPLLLQGMKSAFEIIFSMKNNTCYPYIHTVSTKEGFGIDDLKLFMTDVIAQQWIQQPLQM